MSFVLFPLFCCFVNLIPVKEKKISILAFCKSINTGKIKISINGNKDILISLVHVTMNIEYLKEKIITFFAFESTL